MDGVVQSTVTFCETEWEETYTTVSILFTAIPGDSQHIYIYIGPQRGAMRRAKHVHLGAKAWNQEMEKGRTHSIPATRLDYCARQ